MKYLRTWAKFSADRRFRWVLGRTWKPGPVMHLNMLNPSSAGEDEDDPTVRKGVGFADRAGCGSLLITNLASFCATDPADLLRELKAGWPAWSVIGRETDSYIRDAAIASDYTVIAWGANARHQLLRARAGSVLKMLRWAALGGVYTLKVAPDGIPHHPLMLAYSCSLAPLGVGLEVTLR